MKLNYTSEICVFFLTTIYEFENGELETAIDYYLTELKKSNCKYSFDLFIFFDKSYSRRDFINLKKFKKSDHVDDVIIVSSKIKDKENLYEKNLKTDFPLKDLPLGRSHGINFHFYKTINHLFKTKYENFLLLESDTKPMKSNWFQVVKTYIETNKDFKIAGSLYKGTNYETHRNSYYGGHLNGVGIYKNSLDTKNLINNSKKFLINELMEDHVKPKHKQKYWEFMNYDVAIYLYAKKFDELHGYVDTDIFTNASAPEDSNLKELDILLKHPHTSFLHRKKLYE